LDFKESNILRSKFCRPEPSTDLIIREDLYKQLANGKNKPLFLISAPAGYGKSTLVSSWLGQNDLHFGWVSLSEYDDNWLTFIKYFVECLRQSVPGVFDDSIQMLSTAEVPDSDAIARSIINHLMDIEENFYLVLDDYHYIHTAEIHEFINKVLRFPPPRFHLVVISRIDPPFKIQHFRSKNLITEIRSNDLAIGIDVAITFLTSTTGIAVNQDFCKTAVEITEGWITGLRLISLKLKSHQDFAEIFTIKEKRTIIHDLLDEVFADFSPTVRDFIVKCSVLHQFSAAICAEICQMEKQSAAQTIIDELSASNLFIIPVGQSRGWYRFHHLFQDYLKAKFAILYSKTEQEQVHYRAAMWLRKEELFKGAIIHFLQSGKIGNAIAVFAGFRQQLMNNAFWQELIQTFNFFSEQNIDTEIDLQLARAWINIYEGKPFEVFSQIDHIKGVLESAKLSEVQKTRYAAELCCLNAYKIYNVDQDFQELQDQCDFAIENLHDDQKYVKGYAWIFKLGAMQVLGKYADVKDLTAHQWGTSSKTLKSHLFLVLNYVEWMEADVNALLDNSKQFVDFGQSNHNQEAIANGSHFHGIGNYMTNQLDLAFLHLKRCYEKRYFTIGVIKLMNSVALAMCHLAGNNITAAEATLLEAKKEMESKNSPYFNALLEAAHAEINLACDDTNLALKNLAGIGALPLLPFSNFFVPQFTYVKALIYSSDQTLLESASNLIQRYSDFCEKTNNHLFKLKFMALQAIYYHKTKREEEAFKLVESLMRPTESLRLIRVFADCGPIMRELLFKFCSQNGQSSFIKEVLETFPLTSNSGLLSRRELDVLPLLSHSNREIAERLFIAEKTVKRHSNSIFKKLQVKNRREALQKATELKLV
jgi:LuxR family maltose regulon positive regulatory protein